MTPEQPPERAPQEKVWTTTRLLLAALTFALLAVALPSSCNPSDDSAPTGAGASSNANAAAKTASGGEGPRGSSAPVRRGETEPDPNPQPLPEEVWRAGLTDLDDKTFKLADYEGKVVVVNLWATWCGPCRREIPEFIEMHKEYEGRDVAVVGLTYDDDQQEPEDVEEFVKAFKINYRIAWADRETYVALLQPGFQIPQTYVLSKDGRVLKKFVGYNPQVGNWVRAVVAQALE